MRPFSVWYLIAVEAVCIPCAVLMAAGAVAIRDSFAGPRESVAVEHAIVAAKRDARPELPDTLQNGNGNQPDAGAILGRAIEQAHRDAVRIVKITRPSERRIAEGYRCGFCEQYDANIAGGVPGVMIHKSGNDEGPWPITTIQDAPINPETGKPLYFQGPLTKGQIYAILKKYPPQIRPVQAMTLGKLAIRKPVRDLLSRVIVSGGQTEIRFGSAAIILPSEMQQVVSFPLKGIAITFTGKKPRLRYGSGFLSLGADINSVVLTETQLVLGVAGVPDVALEIVE